MSTDRNDTYNTTSASTVVPNSSINHEHMGVQSEEFAREKRRAWKERHLKIISFGPHTAVPCGCGWRDMRRGLTVVMNRGWTLRRE